MTLVLDNGRIRLEIEREHGTLVHFSHKALDIDLVQEPRLAENFRLLIPLEHWRGHYVLGKEQILRDAQIDGNQCVLTWRGLQSSQGSFDVEVVQTIQLQDDDAIFSLTVTNHSSHQIEEIFNVAVGGMANFAERNDWRLHWATRVGQGTEWAFYDEFPGSYLGPPFPIWTAMYHGDLSMPWVSLYNRRLRKGVYIGNHDMEVRQSTVWAQLIPCTTYQGPANHSQRWPDPAVTGDTPVGITLAWNNFPFLNQGEHWAGPPIVFHFHEGIWWAAADYFRRWFDSHTQFDKSGSWMVEEDAWQSTIISYPEGTVGYRFKDLPQMAQDAKQYGIRVLQIDGWDIGGIDRDYPAYTPDPRLGTWAELADALTQCMAMDVYVMLFTNLQWVNIETEWYERELHRYAVRDPYGHIRGGMGWEYNTTLGLRNQTIYRMVPANPSRPEFKRIILDQLQNVLRLGAPGTQIDKLHVMTEFDYSPDNPAPRDAALVRGSLEVLADFYRQAQAINPDFRIATEAHWDRAMPFVDASYSRFFSNDHIPTYGHTFPEFRQSCCVTGDWDFGLVNNCIRFGHIINVEARCLHGTASDALPLSRYVASALTLRRGLKESLWHSIVVEPVNVKVDASPHLLHSLHRSWQGHQETLVLNHFERSDQTAKVDYPDQFRTAVIHRPDRTPEQVSLPVTVSVPKDEVVVIRFAQE
jgi:hypothetical protein